MIAQTYIGTYFTLYIKVYEFGISFYVTFVPYFD